MSDEFTVVLPGRRSDYRFSRDNLAVGETAVVVSDGKTETIHNDGKRPPSVTVVDEEPCMCELCHYDGGSDD